MKLEGRTILITGGTAGIGFAMAGQLARRGNRVAVCGRTPECVEAAAGAIPGIRGLVCDVAVEEHRRKLHDRLTDAGWRIDVLINNAGIGEACDFAHTPDAGERAQREIEIDLIAPLRMTHLFLPALMEAGEAAVINVTSGYALRPAPVAPGYTAAKSGLHFFTCSLRAQLAGTGVEVFEVLPPMTDTRMTRGAAVHKMSAAAVARKALRGVERGRREICIGEVRWLKAAARWGPGWADRVLRHYPVPVRAVLADAGET